MHSHALAPPPKMPQAIQPSPLSSHSPLLSQRFSLRGLWLGQDGKYPQIPLQTIFGGVHSQAVGFQEGEGVNPSSQLKPQGFPGIQAGTLWSG